MKQAMDAPKKFGIRSFLDRIAELRRLFRISATAVCSTTVLRKYMVVFNFPSSTAITLKDLAICPHMDVENVWTIYVLSPNDIWQVEAHSASLT